MQEEDEEEGSGQGLKHTTRAAWTQMKLACFLVCVHAVLISPTRWEKILGQEPAKSIQQGHIWHILIWHILPGDKRLPKSRQKFPSRNFKLGGIHQLLLLAPANLLSNKAAFSHCVEMHCTSHQAN